MEAKIIERGKKKKKCKACGCKFVLDGDYEVFEKREYKMPIFEDSYYLHHVYTKCPQCGTVVEVFKYKGA